MRRHLATLVAFVTLLAAGSAAAQTTTVLLVRHAEKAATGGSDPALTAEGRARAQRLAQVLEHVDLAAVYSTPFTRTRDTAGPVAAAKRIDLTVTEVGPNFVENLAERILSEQRGKTVLVVGHSNTLGPTIAALGAGEAFELDESEYGDLFVCTIPETGPPTMLRLTF
jgi:broad specificity phosphatase PhoE